jgi:hypothetical protein
MKQPKKLKKKPDLKKRLDAVRSAPEPDISFTVTLPAHVFRSVEAVAGGNVPEWVAQMLVGYVEGEFRADEMMQEDSEDG